jgi:hypothetical protein
MTTRIRIARAQIPLCLDTGHIFAENLRFVGDALGGAA